MRGYGTFAHGTVAELRVGLIPFRIRHPYTGQPVKVGEVQVTEAEEFTISPHRHPNAEDVEQFALGYGLVFGQNERKAIAMAMLDSASSPRVGAQWPRRRSSFSCTSTELRRRASSNT
ncbi:MAG: carbon-phosphorus lyase complex subunit PhnI [Dehalococcoidia bacterium]|nr:carbon-phosphorus lyase complex subunit PhnI [Dehalococcoidia bacterium]